MHPHVNKRVHTCMIQGPVQFGGISFEQFHKLGGGLHLHVCQISGLGIQHVIMNIAQVVLIAVQLHNRFLSNAARVCATAQGPLLPQLLAPRQFFSIHESYSNVLAKAAVRNGAWLAGAPEASVR
jgi:hypothetical protein